MKQKGKINLEKISEIKGSFALPLLEFMDEIDEIYTVFKNPEQSEKIKHCLKNYLLIRSVSLNEHSMKMLVSHCIDSLDLGYKDLLSKNKIIISLEDLELIRAEKKITNGRIIATTYNFQDIDVINDVLTKLIREDFRKAFNKTNKKFKRTFEWEEFLKIFDLRHKIVHSMQTLDELGDMKIVQLSFKILLFICYTFHTVFSKIIELNRENMLQINVDEFIKPIEDIKKIIVKIKVLTEKI